jgi:hypothetical protein
LGPEPPAGGGGVFGSSRATPRPNSAAPAIPPVTAKATREPVPSSEESSPDDSPDPDPGPVVGGGRGPIDGTGMPPAPATRNPETTSGLGPVSTGIGDGVGDAGWLALCVGFGENGGE